MRSENFAVQKKPEIRAKFLNNPKFGLLRELTLSDKMTTEQKRLTNNIKQARHPNPNPQS